MITITKLQPGGEITERITLLKTHLITLLQTALKTLEGHFWRFTRNRKTPLKTILKTWMQTHLINESRRKAQNRKLTTYLHRYDSMPIPSSRSILVYPIQNLTRLWKVQPCTRPEDSLLNHEESISAIDFIPIILTTPNRVQGCTKLIPKMGRRTKPLGANVHLV